MLKRNLFLSTSVAAVGAIASALAAEPVTAAGLDLSGVTISTPDFTDRTFVDGPFSTEFDGTLTNNVDGTLLDGDGAGNLRIGGSSSSTQTYRLDFDDLLNLTITGPEGGQFGIFGSFDSWELSTDAGVNFLVTDDGDTDLANIVASAGSISFTGITGSGDSDWSISTDTEVSFLDITFTNTAGGGNRSTLNIDATGTAVDVPEPATSALGLMMLGSVGLMVRRRQPRTQS